MQYEAFDLSKRGHLCLEIIGADEQPAETFLSVQDAIDTIVLMVRESREMIRRSNGYVGFEINSVSWNAINVTPLIVFWQPFGEARRFTFGWDYQASRGHWVIIEHIDKHKSKLITSGKIDEEV